MEDPRQPMPVAISMIKDAGGVSVRDANMTMAGGHVNHIAVSIALNRQPSPEPISRSVWLRALGQWLLGPQTRLVPPAPSLPELLTPVSAPGIVEAVEGHALPATTPLGNKVEDPDHGSIDIVSQRLQLLRGLLPLT
jgi:hypothetical protein